MMSGRFKSPSGSYGLVTRYPCEIQVKIPKTTEQMYRTQQVSHEGVFVLTEQPLPVNQLVTAFFILPPMDHLQVLCHVKYAVTKFQATEQTPAGMELAIFNMEKEDREKWDLFVDDLAGKQETGDGRSLPGESEPSSRSRTGGFAGSAPGTEAESAPGPAAIPGAPSLVTMEILPRSVKMLVRLIHEEILHGSLIVATDQAVGTGSVVELTLVHPISGYTYTVQGTVSHCELEQEGESAMLTVSFDELDNATRRNLLRFSIAGKV